MHRCQYGNYVADNKCIVAQTCEWPFVKYWGVWTDVCLPDLHCGRIRTETLRSEMYLSIDHWEFHTVQVSMMFNLKDRSERGFGIFNRGFSIHEIRILLRLFICLVIRILTVSCPLVLRMILIYFIPFQ